MSSHSRLIVGALLACLVITTMAKAETTEGTAPVTRYRAVPAAPDVFGTAAINAGVTIYDARFRRVAAADHGDARIQALAAQVAGLPAVQQLAMVKTLVEQRVRLASDPETIRVADYWSSAGDTLTRGAGDDEDIAIVEMQVLKAAGVSPQDLYISVGRHKQQGAHVALIARTSEGFYLLDTAEKNLMAADRQGRFVPMLTMGVGRSWVHGYRVGRPRIVASR